jgi:hypothetical protein
MNKTVIIVAGGSGKRMNYGIPKQFITLSGLPILMHTISRFYHSCKDINIIVVLPPDHIETWSRLCSEHSFFISHRVVKGGSQRFYSVTNGLEYIGTGELVAIHDGTMNYKHIWTRFSYDLGETWGDFYDLQGDNIFHLYDECIYPILADKTNGSGAFQLIYQADNLPGLYLDEDHDAVVNRVIHNNMNFTVGIEKPANMVSPFKVTEAYPNPATSSTIVGVELDKAANIGFEIFNMTGQKVFELPVKAMNAGFNTISFDVSALTSGIYFYTVSNGAEKVSHKLIVK